MQVVPQLETVLDLGGCCDWCDDPLEPGEVVVRAPVSGKRIHQDGCLAEERKSRRCRPGRPVTPARSRGPRRSKFERCSYLRREAVTRTSAPCRRRWGH